MQQPLGEGWVCVTGRVVSGRRGLGTIPGERGEFLLYVEGNPAASLRGDTPEMDVLLDEATGPMVVCGENLGIVEGLPLIVVSDLRGPVAPIGPEPGGWSAGEIAPGAPPLPSPLPTTPGTVPGPGPSEYVPPEWAPGRPVPQERPIEGVPLRRQGPSYSGEWGLGQPWWDGAARAGRPGWRRRRSANPGWYGQPGAGQPNWQGQYGSANPGWHGQSGSGNPGWYDESGSGNPGWHGQSGSGNSGWHGYSPSPSCGCGTPTGAAYPGWASAPCPGWGMPLWAKPMGAGAPGWGMWGPAGAMPGHGAPYPTVWWAF